MSLNLKEIEARAPYNQWGDDVRALLGALRDARAALNDLLRAPFVNIDAMSEQSFTAEERRARTVLGSVVDE